jgi:hypothetical protein
METINDITKSMTKLATKKDITVLRLKFGQPPSLRAFQKRRKTTMKKIDIASRMGCI